MPFEKIISETTPEGVLILTMNDPDTLNALGEPLMPELESEVDRFAVTRDLRVLVITGAGRAFSSGANVRGFQRRINDADAAAEEAPEQRATSWQQLDPDYTSREALGAKTGPPIVPKLHNLHKPSFAAVNGHAYGLGCGIALSCDIRIAGESARFNEAFIRNGLVPADGSAWQLPKLVGMANALWMQYSGEPIDGNEAYRMGLANKVVSGRGADGDDDRDGDEVGPRAGVCHGDRQAVDPPGLPTGPCRAPSSGVPWAGPHSDDVRPQGGRGRVPGEAKA
ncbi:MAG: enoyl-CoA hydratase/isomerase family protein [Dehalococcoidia bacterium]|nr:enoyl-CoA hydratase/isomerase family protein [Dehalococcoidia bacterium]